MKSDSHSPSVSPSSSATLLGFFACLIWSSAVLTSSLLSSAMGALFAAGCELILAGAFLFVVAGCQGKIRSLFSHSPKYILCGGLFWGLNFVLFWLAVGSVRNKEELVVVGLLNYLWPIFTLLLAIPILKKRPNWRLVPGVALAMVGIWVAKISTTPQLSDATTSLLQIDINYWAYGLAILDALAWGLYSNLARLWSNPKEASPVPLFMLATGIPVLIYCYLAGQVVMPSFNIGIILVFWACFSSFAFVSWDIGMRRGSVIAIAAGSMLIPFLSTVITALGAGVENLWILAVSALLVVVGSYLSGKGVTD